MEPISSKPFLTISALIGLYPHCNSPCSHKWISSPPFHRHELEINAIPRCQILLRLCCRSILQQNSWQIVVWFTSLWVNSRTRWQTTRQQFPWTPSTRWLTSMLGISTLVTGSFLRQCAFSLACSVGLKDFFNIVSFSQFMLFFAILCWMNFLITYWLILC